MLLAATSLQQKGKTILKVKSYKYNYIGQGSPEKYSQQALPVIKTPNIGALKAQFWCQKRRIYHWNINGVDVFQTSVGRMDYLINLSQKIGSSF